ESGGSLKGRRIAILFLDSAQGREPLRLLRILSVRHGFRLDLHPVHHPGQEQKAAWNRIREDRPDYVLLWGWGIMNRVAFEEAVTAGYPMQRMIGLWSSANEKDLEALGAAGNGYRTVTFHATGDGFPLYE